MEYNIIQLILLAMMLKLIVEAVMCYLNMMLQVLGNVWRKKWFNLMYLFHTCILRFGCLAIGKA